MLRVVIAFLCFGFSIPVLSAVKVITTLEIEGKKPIDLAMTLEDNKWGIVRNHELEVRIKAISHTKNGARMDFEVYSLENGQREVLGRPVAVAKWGQPVELSSENKDQGFKLSVTANTPQNPFSPHFLCVK